ncbi:MAG: TonB-dependent receptor [Pseudomonadales bacterium]
MKHYAQAILLSFVRMYSVGMPLFISLALALPLQSAYAEEQARTGSPIEEIIVTAQKREESINDVAMSIQAATGEKLNDMGITDTADLYKVVTGFNSNVTYYGTSIYTIRGVGFQDTALASQPTVSVYIDQMPLAFSALTSGVILDLQRVEVLKGPQGTLFGQNSTGGAVNYVANKPTREFESGIDASFGRFSEIDLSGFISGPISETLSYRIAARHISSDGWQDAVVDNPAQDPFWSDPSTVAVLGAPRNYERSDDEWGEKDFTSYRASFQWDPSDTFSALSSFSGFIDKSQSQAPALYGIASLNPDGDLNPLVANYPRAGDDNQDADWGPCVNVAGGDPNLVFTDGAAFSPQGLTIDAVDVDGNGLNLNNRLYDNCEDAERDNDYFNVSLRFDWDLNDDITLTSLTSYGEFDRDQQLESDGTFYQDYESSQDGFLDIFYQELRIAGTFQNKGTWVAGVNYEDISTWDAFVQTYGISSAIPTLGNPLGPTQPNNRQNAETWAVFASFDYPVREDLIVQLGARYTDQERDYRGCGGDAGDGSWSDISEGIQAILQGVFDGTANTVNAGPGGCGSTGPAPLFHPVPSGFTDELNEDNFSWRVGLNWEATPDSLYYINVSQGFKSGSFPTVAAAASLQLIPAKQEELLAYEIGTKLSLADGRVQLNAAAFYYDYTDKQILAAVPDIIFGSLPALVNVPESEVIGAEVSLEWYPIDGLRIAPSVSYAKSEVLGDFESFDPFFNPVNNANPKDFSGQEFPNAPKWQGNIDVQYEWTFGDGMLAFVGMNANFQDETTGFFVDECKDPSLPCTREKSPQACVICDPSTVVSTFEGNTDLIINERLLVDLRAGVETENWRIWAWARNVTDKYYWNQVAHVNDVLLRYTGMPRTYGLSLSYRFQ